ncbi:hypothetical protein D9M68_703710 [compost metagenome]
MVQRQRVQRHVGLGDFCVDHAAHVLPQHCVVREHGALGRGLGTAGVDDLCQIETAQGHLGQRVCAGGEVVKAVHGGVGLARVFAGQPDESLHHGVQGSSIARQRGQAAVGGQGPGARVAQDVGNLVGLEHEVDRHQHRAAARQGEAQRCEAVGIARQNGHLVPLIHAQASQTRGQAADQRVELGVGPLGGAADDGGLARQTQGGAVQGVGNGLAAHHRVKGRGHAWAPGWMDVGVGKWSD